MTVMTAFLRFAAFVAGAGLLLAGCRQNGTGGSEAGKPPPEFAICSACHSADAARGNLIGPNLHGVIGRRAGALPGFGYSSALRDSGIVWSPDMLDRFLQSPRDMVPGTRMAVAVTDPARRRAIIAYLARESDR
jgi:cytochrome c